MTQHNLSSAAIEVLGQLFISGPKWDGNVVSKSGRTELVEAGLAFRTDGFQSLTAEGIKMALEIDISAWREPFRVQWMKKRRGD